MVYTFLFLDMPGNFKLAIKPGGIYFIRCEYFRIFINIFNFVMRY